MVCFAFQQLAYICLGEAGMLEGKGIISPVTFQWPNSLEIGTTVEWVAISHGQVFFRPTPSWLPPGRSTRSIACSNWAARVN